VGEESPSFVVDDKALSAQGLSGRFHQGRAGMTSPMSWSDPEMWTGRGQHGQFGLKRTWRAVEQAGQVAAHEPSRRGQRRVRRDELLLVDPAYPRWAYEAGRHDGRIGTAAVARFGQAASRRSSRPGEERRG